VRSLIEAGVRSLVAAVFLAVAIPPAPAAAQPAATAATGTPDDDEIARALITVKADPNLATERTIKTLRWKDSNKKKDSSMPGWLAWIAGFFGWLDRSARVLVWIVVIGLLGYLLTYALRLARKYSAPERAERFVPPTHVRDLDIRPETLPDDIGAAARALWDRGDHRPALALLYRGLLSRLAHVHGVPIRDSSTEGDCFALASSHLTEGRREYVSNLLRVWQRAVYGKEDVAPATVYGLCENFAPALDRPVQPASPLRGATA
jgi:Domain of unknown function (DUF4129)